MAGITRRGFLAAGAALPMWNGFAGASPTAAPLSRAQQSKALRIRAAERQSARPQPAFTSNGDEDALPLRIGCYTKGLPHNGLGEVEEPAYQALLHAMQTGQFADFERIPRAGGRTLSNPQSSFCFHLEGGDPHSFAVAPAPSLTSPEAAADMDEMYWQALCRDIPFADYAHSPLIARAAASLNRTPANVFRGPRPTDLAGPYLSQFLLKPIPFGATRVEQRYTMPKPGSDFMTTFSEWSQLQTGFTPFREAEYDSTPRFLRTGRDIAEVVHYDFPFQAGLSAALILVNSSAKSIHNCNQFRSGNNPYRYSTVEDGFVTFGPAEATDWMGRVTTAALKATYFQKWAVHRRVRPEELGALIHKTRTGRKAYPLHPSLVHSDAADAVFAATGSYLLPQAYPEGCPLHPSYPSGHAAIIGACAVVLKACFDGSMLLPGCVEPSPDGLHLVPCKDYSPTVGAEIDKLAFNVAMGRGWGGIHYRTDHLAGLKLGEDVAISILQDIAGTYSEAFHGFALTKFDGTRIVITPDGEIAYPA